MIGEDEYDTATTVPAWAEAELSAHYRLHYVLATEAAPTIFSGLDGLAESEALFVSVRRRCLPIADLERIRAFVARGKPVIGIRTASHAFSPKNGTPVPTGAAAWPEWDATVLGGHYMNHHGATAATTAELCPTAPADHPILRGWPAGLVPTGGSLYKNTPLSPQAVPLLLGRAAGIVEPEPIAWTHTTAAGGRVFYTSLGHPADFARPEFRRLLRQAVEWATHR
jgi:Trehalose utilisation